MREDQKITVITAGQQYADIDVLACSISYSELLNFLGQENEVVLPGTLNNSITPTIKNWNLKYLTKPTDLESNFILVDISELTYMARFVKLDCVVEVYDHRFGFQDFWGEKLGGNAHIELVGACATLIWEEYEKRGFAEKISPLSANLISVAILSNTLNFGSSVTTDRDKQAFEKLKKYVNLSENWQEIYFNEVEASVFQDIRTAIVSDTKVLQIPSINFPVVAGQLELWDASEFLLKYRKEAKEALQSFGESEWFLSLPSISEKKNYIFTESEKIKKILQKIFPIIFDGNVGVTDKMWLRKEIRKKLLEL